MITNYLEKEFTLKKNLSQIYPMKREFFFFLTFIEKEFSSNFTLKKKKRNFVFKTIIILSKKGFYLT